MAKEIKLICVTGENNNKFYTMKENGDGTFTATYGRVDLTSAVKNYPMSKWNSIYKSKTKSTKKPKPYTDVTHLFLEADDDNNTNKNIEIKDLKVREFVSSLQKFANISIEQNYSVSSKKVTQAQVDEAQLIVDNIFTLLDVRNYNSIDKNIVNNKLLELYRVIPRKMKKVQDHLITLIQSTTDLKNAKHLLAEEQANLDVMATQVIQQTKSDPKDKIQKQIDILEQLGLEIVKVSKKEEDRIKEFMGPNKHQFRKAFKVINKNTQKHFDNWLDEVKNKKKFLFWHGSRNENWWSIINSGLILRPTNAVITGAMFGEALYFASKCQKSIGYSSLRGSYWTGGGSSIGLLALFEVHTGNQYHIKKWENWHSQLTEDKLKKLDKDYNSVFAHGGADLRNDEFMIYNQNQTTIKYLIEIN